MVGTAVGKPVAGAVAARLHTGYATTAKAVTAGAAQLTFAAAPRHGRKPKRLAVYGVLPPARGSEANATA